MRGEKTTITLIAMALCLLPVAAQAQLFPPGPADDATISLGQALIWVHPNHRPLVQPLPGWNPATGHWLTPVMGDMNTIIGRSAVHRDSSSVDIGGTPVGTAGTWISDASFTVVPTSGFNAGPPGTRELHTEIWSLNMQDPSGCIRLRAGTGTGVPRISPGEVEALQATSDYPAESFFNVFVEIDAPFGTLCNPPGFPLVVVSSGLMKLPPVVIYIHGNTNAVPVRFETGNGLCDGPLFGYLRLAGHGTYPPTAAQCGPFDCTGVSIECPEAAELTSVVLSGNMMHCSQCVVTQPTDTEPIPTLPTDELGH